MKLIFDSHLDLAWNAISWKRDITLPLGEMNQRDAQLTDHVARGRATVSLPEMRRSHVAVCLGTLMARTPHGTSRTIFRDMLDYPTQEIAYAAAQGQLAYYRVLQSKDEIALLHNAQQLDEHWQRWESAEQNQVKKLPIGIILATEGSDAIVDPEQAELWFAEGLRCASLVHYGRSAYAGGTGDDPDAPGLTPRGRDMLEQFEKLGIILDVTHLSDTSFFEAMDSYNGPVLASHQNCRALVPGGRQFSDEQIKLVIERGGILGIALDAWMLHPGWKSGDSLDDYTPRELVALQSAVDHVDHICHLAGNCDHVAIGSDLDGGFGTEQTPSGLDSIADLRKFQETMSTRGYGEEEIDAFYHGNWLRFFLQHLPNSWARG